MGRDLLQRLRWALPCRPALPSRPTSADAVAMAVVLALCVLSVYGEVSIPLPSSA